MQYIDEKFKDATPEATVERIKGILKSINIEVTEDWHDSGIDNCHSLTLRAGGAMPTSNGKGVTKALAQASAYGEFIERLQTSLFFYKFQSFISDPEVNLQTFAPDGKYFTKEELLENADWFDFLTESYEGLTRESLANQCGIYAHTDDGKILCLPFYNIFEDKYVYLPIGFVEYMYGSNGCCVGNTKEEALVHALSEIMERKASSSAILSNCVHPKIPRQILDTFPTVAKILKKIDECEDLDVSILDCSLGNGLPIVCTRIINKISHSYHINYAADPIFEIAIQRSLTETFQARNLSTIALNESKPILSHISKSNLSANAINQLESSNGLFTADFFAEEITCTKPKADFQNNSDKTNTELLKMMLELYKEIKHPVLVRNYNFLGFPCYLVIVPGYSEARSVKLTEPVNEYAMGDFVSKILRNPKKFDKFDLSMVINFNKMIEKVNSSSNNFRKLAGLPLKTNTAANRILWNVTMAYISLCTGDIKSTIKYADTLTKICPKEDRDYFACVRQYFTLKHSGIDDDKIFVILKKFNKESALEKFEVNLKNNTFFDEYLLECDTRNCENCRYKSDCHYEYIRTFIGKAGEIYKTFTDGQSKENFVTL